MNAAIQQLLWVTALATLAGCASQPVADVPAESGDAAVDVEETQVVDTSLVCRTEARTGSHMHVKRCYTRTELAKMEQESRDFLRSRGSKGKVYTPTDPADPRKNDK